MKLLPAILLMIPAMLLAQPKPQAVKGTYLIRQDHLTASAIISLDGEWEFYWNRLLTPDSFQRHEIVRQYKPVPLKWNSYRVDGKKLPVRGYCTYRLLIENPDRLADLMIKIPGIATASKIWINGNLTREQGVVATAAEFSKAKRLHNFLKLRNESTIELVIQASNYEYPIPGISHAVLIGHEADVVAKEKLENDFEMIEIGCLLIMIFYHFALFIQLGFNRSYLLLSLLCVVVLVRATTTYHSSLLLFRLFPSLDFLLIKKLEFAFTYGAIMLLPMFVQSLFPQDTPQRGVRLLQAISVLMVLLVVFSPPHTSGQVLDFFHVVMTGCLIFLLWILFRAIRNNRQGSWLIFTGLLICCLFVEFEILIVSNLIPEKYFPFPNPVGIGIIVFLLFQSLALSIRFATALRDVEDLTHALEKRVEKRTEELSRANLVKDKLFSIISHDLRSPLNSLRGLLDLTNKDGITPNEIKLLLPSIRQNLNGSLQLLDNLLNWASSQMKGVKTKAEQFKLTPIIEENLNLYKTIAKNKDVKLINRVASQVEVIADANITKLIIRNLVSNAIKFTSSGGKVEITAVLTGEEVEICVSDTGVGVPEEFKERIFQIDINRTTPGTNNEKGTGIGLLLVKEFVEKNNGRLWLESEKDKGSKFKFNLPAVKTEKNQKQAKKIQS
jgi:two-component system sensor histidine kinase ChiS